MDSIPAAPPPPGAARPPGATPTPPLDAEELHRRAVAVREARTGAGSHPAWGASSGDNARDGTWRSRGYRSSWLRARFTIGLLAATVAMDLVGTALDIQGVLLMDAADAGTLTEPEVSAFDSLYSTVGLIQLAAYLGSLIAVLAWLSRVVENIPPLTERTPRRSPREAIGWWFVPFAAYVVPYQIVADAMRRLRTGDEGLADRLLLPWWGVWLVASFVGSLIWRLPTETIGDLRTSFVITAISDAANVIAGILLIVIVRAADQREEARAAALGLGRGSMHAWPGGTGGAIESPAVVETLVADAAGPLQPPPSPGSERPPMAGPSAAE